MPTILQAAYLRSSQASYRQALVFPAELSTQEPRRVMTHAETVYYLLELADGRCVLIGCEQPASKQGLQEELARLVIEHGPKSLSSYKSILSAEKAINAHSAWPIALLSVSLDGRFVVPYDDLHGYIQDHFPGGEELDFTHPEILHRLESLMPFTDFDQRVHRYYKPLAAMAAQIESLSALTQTFTSRLQALPWQALQASGYSAVPARYNWLAEHQHNGVFSRAQAILDYPLLSYYFLEDARGYADQLRVDTKELRLLAALNGLEPLAPAVMAYKNCSESVVNCLASPAGKLGGEYWQHRPWELLPALSLVPPERYPQDAEDWKSFKLLYKLSPSSFESVWFSSFAAAGWKNAGRALKHAKLCQSDLQNISRFHDEILGLLSCVLRGVTRVVAYRRFNKLLANVPPLQFMQASRRWDQHLVSKENHVRGEAQWPIPFAGFFEHEQIRILCCRNRFDLFRAFRDMPGFYGFNSRARVIKRYAETCLREHGQVLMLYSGEQYRSFAVLKLVQTNEGCVFQLLKHHPVGTPLEEHAGIVPSNLAAEAEDQAACAALLEWLKHTDQHAMREHLYATGQLRGKIPKQANPNADDYLSPLSAMLPEPFRGILADKPSPGAFTKRVYRASRPKSRAQQRLSEIFDVVEQADTSIPLIQQAHAKGQSVTFSFDGDEFDRALPEWIKK